MKKLYAKKNGRNSNINSNSDKYDQTEKMYFLASSNINPD